VYRPFFLTRIEDWYDVACYWITPLATIASTFVAVATSKRQVIRIIRSTSRQWQHMVNRKADELPSFVSMAVFAPKLCTFARDTAAERGHCHSASRVV